MHKLKKWIHNYRLSKVVKELPFYLGRDISPKEKYKGKVIVQIYNKYSFNNEYLKYAFALVSSEHEFNNFVKNTKDSTYKELKNEIAQIYFNGNCNFSFSDLMRITRFKGQVHTCGRDGFPRKNNEGWSFSSGDSNGDGGGADGGGGD